MEPKPESSFNASASERRWVGRSLARAGVHFGQVVTGALASSLDALEERLNSGPKSSGAAHGRMRDLLNQDRALLAVTDNTARVERDKEDESQAPRPSVRNAVKSGGAARGRMRELLQRDRVMLSSPDDDEDFDELKRAAGVADGASAEQPAPVVDFAAPECAAVQIVEVNAPVPQPPQPTAAPVSLVSPTAAEPTARAVPLSAAALSALPAAASMPVVPPVSAAPRPASSAADLDGNAPIRTRTMAKLLALQGHKDRALDIYAELIAADPNDAGLAAEAERLRK